MNPLGPSWKTTMSGIVAILASLTHIADALMTGKPIDWTVALAGLTSGIGLIFARDNKVSSEAVGAVKPAVTITATPPPAP